MHSYQTIGVIFAAAVLMMPVGSSFAAEQTQVYIENNSDYDLIVTDVGVAKGRLSKKAWKKGVVNIASGQRDFILSINRTGKFNWMDPTPRFVEPGKTVVFSADLAVDGIDGANTIGLKQKLLGTGSSSRMWHGISLAQDTGTQVWMNDAHNYSGTWRVNDQTELSFVYRTYEDEGETHIEYIFAMPQ